jgi:hypothetical protein
MSVYGMTRKQPYREDLLVLAVTALMIFTLYGTVDYPLTVADIKAQGGGGGGAQPQTNVTHIVEEPLVDQNGNTNEGQSTNVDTEVPWADLTWVNVTLTWTDDIGSNDEFEVKVTVDGSELGKASGVTGAITVDLKGPPNGNYTVVITCVDAPGLVGPFPIDRDSGNSWNLKAVAVREVQG